MELRTMQAIPMDVRLQIRKYMLDDFRDHEISCRQCGLMLYRHRGREGGIERNIWSRGQFEWAWKRMRFCDEECRNIREEYYRQHRQAEIIHQREQAEDAERERERRQAEMDGNEEREQQRRRTEMEEFFMDRLGLPPLEK
jgi:hypothetical protein